MIIDKNRQQLLAELAEVAELVKGTLAEGTEIVVKTMIDTVDKNAPAIAKAIFSFLDAMEKESDKRKPKESSGEENAEKLGEFLSILFGATTKKQTEDGSGPAGYV